MSQARNGYDLRESSTELELNLTQYQLETMRQTQWQCAVNWLVVAFVALLLLSADCYAQLKKEDLLDLAKPISQEIKAPSHNVIWCGQDTLVSAVVVGDGAEGERTNLKYTDLRLGRTWTRTLDGARIIVGCSATGAAIISAKPVGPRTSTVMLDDFDANSRVTLASEVGILGVDPSGQSLVVAVTNAENVELRDLRYFDLKDPTGSKPLDLSALLPSVSERSVVVNATVSQHRIALLLSLPRQSNTGIGSNADLKLAMVDASNGASRIVVAPTVSARWHAPAAVEVWGTHIILSGWLFRQNVFELIKCDFSTGTRPTGGFCGPVTSVYFDVNVPPLPPVVSERLVLTRSEECDYLVASRLETRREFDDQVCLTIQAPTYVGVEPGIEAVFSPDGKKLAIIAARMGDHDAGDGRRKFVEDNTWLVFSVTDFIRSLSKRRG